MARRRWQTSQQEAFDFFNAEEGGTGGRSETIDLIMHACFPIHCNGGKGKWVRGVGVGGEDQ